MKGEKSFFNFLILYPISTKDFLFSITLLRTKLMVCLNLKIAYNRKKNKKETLLYKNTATKVNLSIPLTDLGTTGKIRHADLFLDWFLEIG